VTYPYVNYGQYSNVTYPYESNGDYSNVTYWGGYWYQNVTYGWGGYSNVTYNDGYSNVSYPYGYRSNFDYRNYYPSYNATYLAADGSTSSLIHVDSEDGLTTKGYVAYGSLFLMIVFAVVSISKKGKTENKSVESGSDDLEMANKKVSKK